MTKKHPPPGALDRARILRRDITDAERQVWRILRFVALAEFRFRRQVPIGPFIADFACHGASLIIEVDGGQHDPESPQEIAGAKFLNVEGYRVTRFWNNEVLSNPEGVHLMIMAELGAGDIPTEEQSARQRRAFFGRYREENHPHLTSPIKGEGHEV
jgi:very-short-patch-repair endonuclease